MPLWDVTGGWYMILFIWQLKDWLETWFAQHLQTQREIRQEQERLRVQMEAMRDEMLTCSQTGLSILGKLEQMEAKKQTVRKKKAGEEG
jgi:hypothetical protein